LTAAYTYAPAKSISVYDYTQVLFTALWGLIFLSEIPDWISIIGYVIIIGAAVIKYMVARNEGKSKKSE
jgi:drug/metabolite transporter (DMT)-like permease